MTTQSAADIEDAKKDIRDAVFAVGEKYGPVLTLQTLMTLSVELALFMRAQGFPDALRAIAADYAELEFQRDHAGRPAGRA